MAFVTWQTWTTGQVVTAADLNQDIRDNLNALFPDEEAGVSWSPTLEATTTDPTVSATAGVEYTIGAIQFFWARWVLSAAGSGTYFVTLPSTASGVTASTTDAAGQRVGGFVIRDDSPGWASEGAMYLHSTTVARFLFPAEGGVSHGLLTHNNMRAWASGDVLSIEGAYPIA